MIKSITTEIVAARNVATDENGKALPLSEQVVTEEGICFGGTVYKVVTERFTHEIQLNEDGVWYDPNWMISNACLVHLAEQLDHEVGTFEDHLKDSYNKERVNA